MFSGKIITAEFPERRIEITDVDHVACYQSDLDPIADAIRLAHEDINPADKTRDRRLQCKAEYQRDQTKRNNSRVPVLKEDR